jgi:uncharacterized membrane protein
MSLIIDSIAAVHVISSVFALAIGMPILAANKGDKAHIARVRLFVIAMIILNVTALFIYRYDGFSLPHWFAIVSLPIIIAGFWLARKKPFKNWQRGHIFCMVFSYYLLLAGAINEAFLHLPMFSELTLDERFTLPAYYISHGVASLMFLVALVGFLVRYSPKRHLKRAISATPAEK